MWERHAPAFGKGYAHSPPLRVWGSGVMPCVWSSSDLWPCAFFWDSGTLTRVEARHLPLHGAAEAGHVSDEG